jgi:glycerol-3-phosphate dehydrogenase
LQGIISIIGGKLTTYRNLAEQSVDRVDRKLDAGLPRCSTSSTLLPGAVGVVEAREQLEDFGGLSERGRERIISIYGGRATLILDLAAAEAGLSKVIDAEKSVLAAEVVFAIRHEYAKNLTDLMHRRLMLGLSADLGEQVTEAVAAIAAAEWQWDEQELERQIGMLREYNARLQVV